MPGAQPGFADPAVTIAHVPTPPPVRSTVAPRRYGLDDRMDSRVEDAVVDLRSRSEELLRALTANPDARFRYDQWEAIEALVDRRATVLVVQRTGWGKSAVYFIATRLLRDDGAGPTLLVSPLLALMRNQIEAAARLGIRAETINSSNNEEWDRVREALEADAVDVLLISP